MTAASARGRSNRRRGHDTERLIVRWLRANGWPDAHTTRNTGGAGGHQHGDIIGPPLVVIEVKNVAGAAWPTWIDQAKAEASLAGPGCAWMVVRRTPGHPDPAGWATVSDPAIWDDTGPMAPITTPGKWAPARWLGCTPDPIVVCGDLVAIAVVSTFADAIKACR